MSNVNNDNIFGEGEGGATIAIPNPMNIQHKKYNFDFYCALAAQQLFSMVDMEQYSNTSDITQKVINRIEYFAKEIKKKWPEAFE